VKPTVGILANLIQKISLSFSDTNPIVNPSLSSGVYAMHRKIEQTRDFLLEIMRIAFKWKWASGETVRENLQKSADGELRVRTMCSLVLTLLTGSFLLGSGEAVAFKIR
jgi:hypothetical protein